MDDMDFKMAVELILAMSRDFLLGEVNKETYIKNLSIYASYFERDVKINDISRGD